MTLVMSISQEQTGVMTDRKPYFEICRLVRNHISEDFVRKNLFKMQKWEMSWVKPNVQVTNLNNLILQNLLYLYVHMD